MNLYINIGKTIKLSMAFFLFPMNLKDVHAQHTTFDNNPIYQKYIPSAYFSL